jgi:hypothetical protein
MYNPNSLVCQHVFTFRARSDADVVLSDGRVRVMEAFPVRIQAGQIGLVVDILHVTSGLTSSSVVHVTGDRSSCVDTECPRRR